MGICINQIHTHGKGAVAIDWAKCECKEIQIKGFKRFDDSENGLYMYLPWAKCRIDQRIMERKHQFRVSIIGNSRPVAFGLSSLFVNEEQKLCDFLVESDRSFNDKNEGNLLYELQRYVRERIYELLKSKSVKKVDTALGVGQVEDPEKRRLRTYCNLVT